MTSIPSPLEISPAQLCFSDRVAHDPLYSAYHDTEWGRPVHDDTALFERLCLEGFQVGLSWRTVLHKREAFRVGFAGFDPATVAAFGPADIVRLLGDDQIIRNRAKIAACVRGAQLVAALHEQGRTLDEIIWSHRPPAHVRPATSHVRASRSVQSQELAEQLRGLGFRFVGPVNCYATMQACGLINDHVVGCVVGDRIAAAS